MCILIKTREAFRYETSPTALPLHSNKRIENETLKMGADFQLLRYVCVDLVQVKHNEGSKIQTQIILFETLAYIKSTHKCNISLI